MTQTSLYRILLIDDQEAIHADYRKVLGAQSSTTTAINAAAASLFDDEPDTHFEWEGFDLESAYQGQQGYELVQRSIEEGRPYALAFVDIRMPPGWDGVQTVQRIWEVDPEILIVFCSAYSDYSWEEMVRKLGRNDRFLILKKPFDNIEVRQCAMALTERWAVSRTDVLTGLLNRRAFHGHLKLEWARSQRYEFPMACVMIDLDYFKRVNDTFGHHAGDRVLKIVAEQLKSHCRASDYICRYGGEELCVLLPHTDETGAAAWAEHTRQAIASAPVVFGEHSMTLTASFGVSEQLMPDDTMEQMIDRADQSLLVAKKSGRNRVVHYSATTASGESALQQAGGRGNVFQGILASQVMNAPVASLPADATAGEAAEFFLQFRVNSAPVVDLEGKLIGILSEKDVLGIIFSQDAWSTPIARIMQRNVVCYEEDADVQSICEFLGRVAIRRVVIVRDGRPTGVVSRGSLLRWYANAMTASDGADPAVTLHRPDESTRLRLIESAQAVAHCASQLAESISSPVDDLAVPVIEGLSKLQELVNGFLTGSVGREPRASVADTLLASLESSANSAMVATLLRSTYR